MGVNPSGRATETGAATRAHPGQADRATSARKATSSGGVRGRTDTDTPRMSSEVIIAAGPTMQVIFLPMSDRSNSYASTDISSTDAPPRLFNKATWGPSPIVADSLSIIAAIACSALEKSICSTPGSPWMPRPSSAFPAAIRLSLADPGTVQVSSDMPMDLVPVITRSAAAATVARLAPCSARWPAILCTKSVPARPRDCGRLGRAMSSSTITMLTFRPKARARSAARPKFSLSPV